MLDIVLGLILLVGIIRGFMKGFIYEVAVLGALFLGLWAGFKFADLATPYVLKVISPDPKTLYYISGFVMFLAVAIGIFFLAKLFEGLVNIAALGMFNKIAGALFSLCKYILILSICIFYFNKLDTKFRFFEPDTKANSKLYYPLMKAAPFVLPIMESAESKIKEEIKSINK
ncbi:MAG: CvpA family protein [Bacteroidetes bacterium]|nr:MAG: CvpA family protein [Bacteroidota bacterium]REK05751.1 MAG: CvpA family protein [Bacteroidota bacterium]REK31942.1 MAG: CvpA family protein [Bacteroidota bacterium]REK50008.1 MAG: CvpA family protein [Bacteroidota bacterium]